MNYLILLCLIPITVEIIGDLYFINKGKQDLHWGFRLAMLLLVSIDYQNSTLSNVILQSNYFLWCLSLYCFFDPALNLWRFRDFKKWKYIGETKPYDIFLSRFNPHFLLCLRVIAFVFILWVAWRVS